MHSLSEEEVHGSYKPLCDQIIQNPKPCVQVLDDNSSYSDTLSSPSLQSYLTSTSEDSNTVYIYDFTKQETRAMPSVKAKSIESQNSELSAEEQPTTSGAAGGLKPTRRSTPMAFKFLQPKRRLIDPSQVLSIDEEAPPESMTSSYDKSVIEEEVIHVLPSVKALAQAFLLSSNTMPQVQRRWTSKIKSAPATPCDAISPLNPRKMMESKSFAEGATLSSQNIHLNRNVSESDVKETTSGRSSPTSSRYLKTNIAFFENLKFK